MVETVRSPAIPRAVAILEYIAQNGASTVSDISDRTGMARSSGSDLCSSLEAERFLRRLPDGRFKLGRTLAQAASGLTAGIPIAGDFVATCEKVDGLGGVTVTFDTLYSDEMLCVAVRHGRLNIPLTPRPGRRLPLVGSSAGRALLAGTTADDLRAHFERFSGMLVSSPDALDDILRTRAGLARPSGDLTMTDLVSERGAEVSHPVLLGGNILGVVTATVPVGHFAGRSPIGHAERADDSATGEALAKLAADVQQAALLLATRAVTMTGGGEQ